MPRQQKREPLTQDEANRLANACQSHEEKLVIWTLLDTGLRVAELADLAKENIDWQTHRLIIFGKGGPYGKKSKRRIVPLTPRAKPLVEGHWSLHDSLGFDVRTIQRMVKRVANRHTSASQYLRTYSDTPSQSQPSRRACLFQPSKESSATTAWLPQRSI